MGWVMMGRELSLSMLHPIKESVAFGCCCCLGRASLNISTGRRIRWKDGGGGDFCLENPVRCSDSKRRGRQRDQQGVATIKDLAREKVGGLVFGG